MAKKKKLGRPASDLVLPAAFRTIQKRRIKGVGTRWRNTETGKFVKKPRARYSR